MTMHRPGLVPSLLAGCLVGALWTLLQLGPVPFSLRGTAGILAAGAAFGAVLALVLRLFRNTTVLAVLVSAAASGVVAGAAWWVLVRPPSSLTVAVLWGGGIAIGLLALELWFERAAA